MFPVGVFDFGVHPAGITTKTSRLVNGQGFVSHVHGHASVDDTGSRLRPAYSGLVSSLVEEVSAVIFDFFGTLTLGAPAELWLAHASEIAASMDMRFMRRWTSPSQSVLLVPWETCREPCKLSRVGLAPD